MSDLDAFGRVIPSLLVVLGALFALRWWARRHGGAPSQLVRVTSRTGLSRGAMLAVVQVGERRLLVGATDHAVNLITELPPAEPADEEGSDALPPPATDAGDAGPRMGFVDRLREMTVRTPPRPPRARP